MSCYPEPDWHVIYTVKVVLDLPNNVTKRRIKDATGIDTSDLAAKRYCLES